MPVTEEPLWPSRLPDPCMRSGKQGRDGVFPCRCGAKLRESLAIRVHIEDAKNDCTPKDLAFDCRVHGLEAA